MWGREKVNGEMGHEEGVGWIRGSIDVEIGRGDGEREWNMNTTLHTYQIMG